MSAVLHDEVLLRVDGLTKQFPVRRKGLSRRSARSIEAVSDVSFEVRTGRTLGLVGESGCGKSTTARCVLRLINPTSGRVLFRSPTEDGAEEVLADLTSAPPNELRRLRRNMQIVFQDPYASLNPRMTVASIVSEPLAAFGVGTRSERSQRVGELLELVGLKPHHARRYPMQFSGGERQRIGIARALALNPTLVILDEPVSALDVSVQAQVLNLLRELQDRIGLTYLFIAHDLSVVRYMSDEVAVMYLGKIVERADRRTVLGSPLHPYTHALLSAVPVPDPAIETTRHRIILEGELPTAANPPSGCRFRTRCPVAEVPGVCSEIEPELCELEPNHWVRCHFPQRSLGEPSASG